MTYEIIHNEIPVPQIDTQGSCHILSKKFMPFNLYLEEIDNDRNNLSNFYFWCANRIMSPERQYADVISKKSQSYNGRLCSNCTLLSLSIKS